MVLVMGIFGLIPHFANHCTGMAANSANQSLCVNKLQISEILMSSKFQFQSWVLSARPNWNNGAEGLISTWPTTPKLAHVPSQRRLPWLHAHEHNGEFPIPVSTSIPLGISRSKSESHCKAPRWNARNAIRKPFFLLLETSFLLFGVDGVDGFFLCLIISLRLSLFLLDDDDFHGIGQMLQKWEWERERNRGMGLNE